MVDLDVNFLTEEEDIDLVLCVPFVACLAILLVNVTENTIFL